MLKQYRKGLKNITIKPDETGELRAFVSLGGGITKIDVGDLNIIEKHKLEAHKRSDGKKLLAVAAVKNIHTEYS
ncbi:hypothetical protein AB4356_07720 [Vibrio lentus]